MKKLVYLLVAILGLTLSSCDGEAKLGKQIAGEWTTGSMELVGLNAASAYTTDVFQFVPDSTYKCGEVQVVGMFAVTLADNSMSGVNEGVSTTISGKSTVSGKYVIKSDDEMILNLAVDKIGVEIDPSTVMLENNVVTSADSVAVGNANAQQMQAIKAQITGVLQAKYAGMRMLDDVKVKGNQMNFEVLDTDYYLTR